MIGEDTISAGAAASRQRKKRRGTHRDGTRAHAETHWTLRTEAEDSDEIAIHSSIEASDWLCPKLSRWREGPKVPPRSVGSKPWHYPPGGRIDKWPTPKTTNGT